MAGNPGQMDEMKMMADQMVDMAKCEDAVQISEGVSTDEIESAMMYYMQAGDKEVTAVVQKFQQQMMVEAQKAGAGGMFGM